MRRQGFPGAAAKIGEAELPACAHVQHNGIAVERLENDLFAGNSIDTKINHSYRARIEKGVADRRLRETPPLPEFASATGVV